MWDAPDGPGPRQNKGQAGVVTTGDARNFFCAGQAFAPIFSLLTVFESQLPRGNRQ
jgi:hypothetical protein